MYKKSAIACLVAAGIGLLPLPYAYYILLRLLFCGCLLFIGHAAYKKTQNLTPPLFIIGGLAVLYNPIFPVYLGSKLVWLGLNIATLGFMFWVVAEHKLEDEAE